MAGWKTNELPGTRAELHYCRMSASKARAVLSLIRGRDVTEASQILQLSQRDAARVVGKVLASAVANAEHNDEQDPEQLYVATCFADEASTLDRWRPRARGRAARIRKRTCHITVIVSRMPDERLRSAGRRGGAAAAQRARRVAAARRAEELDVGALEEAEETAAVAHEEPTVADVPEAGELEEESATTEGPEAESESEPAHAEEAEQDEEEEEGEAATDEDVGGEPDPGTGEPDEGADTEEGE